MYFLSCVIFKAALIFNISNRKREKGKGKKEQKANGEPISPVSEEPESVDRNLFGENGMEPPSAGFSVSVNIKLCSRFL